MRVNTDRTPLVHQRYKVRDLPTLVFLTRTGLYVTRFVNDNRNAANKILARMHAAIDGEQAVLDGEKRLAEAAAEEPTNPDRWKALGDYHAARHGTPGAIAAYRRSYALAARPETIGALIAFYLRDRRFAEALAACDEGLARFGRTRDAAPLLYYKGLGLVHGAGDRAGARVVWQALVDRFPHSSWARRARKLMVKYRPR